MKDVVMSLTPIVRDEHSAPFFDAAARGVLMLRYSPSSGEWSEPAAMLCSVTHADDLEWRASSGRGELMSWTVKPGRAGDDPPAPDTVIGVVELSEGPWITLQLIEADPADLRVGLPVRVGFVPPDEGEEGEHLPVGRVQQP
jgi:uncharacterized protein